MNTESLSGQITTLIKMANQIAINMQHQKPEDQVADDIAAHLRRFWAKSMKQSIVRYAQEDGAELLPLARAAITRL